MIDLGNSFLIIFLLSPWRVDIWEAWIFLPAPWLGLTLWLPTSWFLSFPLDNLSIILNEFSAFCREIDPSEKCEVQGRLEHREYEIISKHFELLKYLQVKTLTFASALQITTPFH